MSRLSSPFLLTTVLGDRVPRTGEQVLLQTGRAQGHSGPYYLFFSFFPAVLGMEPNSSHMLGRCSSTELHTSPHHFSSCQMQWHPLILLQNFLIKAAESVLLNLGNLWLSKEGISVIHQIWASYHPRPHLTLARFCIVQGLRLTFDMCLCVLVWQNTHNNLFKSLLNVQCSSIQIYMAFYILKQL